MHEMGLSGVENHILIISNASAAQFTAAGDGENLTNDSMSPGDSCKEIIALVITERKRRAQCCQMAANKFRH